jgi:glycosyltransferase involved in cell wall biosynthesis
MKIAILAPSGVPYAVGGAEKLWWGMLEGLRANTAHEVELLKIPSPERNMREIIASYRYFSELNLNHFDMVITTKYPAWMVWHYNHRVYLQHKLRGLYDTYPAGLPVELENWPEVLLELRKLLERAPAREDRAELFAELQRLLDTLPTEQWDEYFTLPGPLARQVVHWLDSSALAPGLINKYMAISHNVAGRADYFPPGVPVQVIHHPSDLEPADPGPGEYLFTVSRLDPPKRLGLLVRAMRQSTADMELRIAGSGPQLPELEKLAAGDARIKFLGRVPDSDLRSCYSRALCVAFLPEDEDYGLVTVEAMQAGKPVLTCSDSGGVTELVEDGRTGWVVPPDVHSLASAIETIARSRKQVEKMHSACLERVVSINWTDTISALLDNHGLVDVYGYLEAGKPGSILVPLTFPVWPAHTGGQKRVFHLYRCIARYSPVTLLTTCNHEEPAFDAEIAPGLRELRVPKSLEHQRGERVVERELGASIADLYAIEHMEETPEFMARLKELARHASLVVASHPYLYPAIRAVYRGRVYYEAHNVEYDMKCDILAGQPAAKPWLELIKTTEGDCARDAVGVSACSEEDAARFASLYDLDLDRIALVPNGVDAAAIPNLSVSVRRRVAQRRPGQRPAALFMGSWYGPNIEAVTFIIESLAAAQPDCVFWVLGSVCRYDFGPLPDNVIMFGQVSETDKNAVLSCAQVAINPMQSGSGSNLKMAEYVAAGLPVVSTPFGCRGLDLTVSAALFQAEMSEFAEKLEKVVNQSVQGALDGVLTRAEPAAGVGHSWHGIAKSYFGHIVSVCQE